MDSIINDFITNEFLLKHLILGGLSIPIALMLLYKYFGLPSFNDKIIEEESLFLANLKVLIVYIFLLCLLIRSDYIVLNHIAKQIF